MSSPIIVWFRRDLRLQDHPALAWAQTQNRPLVALYIYNPEDETPWQPGAASRWWLHYSLKSLSESLHALGSRLIFRRGPSLEALLTLIHETKASSVVWSRLYEPTTIHRDEIIKLNLRQQGIEALSFNSSLLHEPWELKTQSETPYKVFTPFYKARTSLSFLPVATKPSRLVSLEKIPISLSVDDLKLRPTIGWDATMSKSWTPGEGGAHLRLKQTLANIVSRYADKRDFPDLAGTSRLSAHLHFGEISPLRIVSEMKRLDPHFLKEKSGETFFKELYWREFAHYILFHFPKTSDEPLDSKFYRFPWETNKTALLSWQRGLTGYPIVDAGMRELWSTGWMHNRVRMIVASFLTKDLRISWLEGARWFWDTLVDADLAANTMGWQWSAGCGADAAPYFRVFNPVLQSKKFDPDGGYIRRWIPELANVSGAAIHEPWKLPGLSYVKPIVQHDDARKLALKAYQSLRGAIVPKE